jgi:hypothetical protein
MSRLVRITSAKRGHFYIRHSQTLDFARQLLAQRPGTRFRHNWRNDCQSTTAIYRKYSKLDRSNTGENIDAKLMQVCDCLTSRLQKEPHMANNPHNRRRTVQLGDQKINRGLARDFVADAFAHSKFIAYSGSALPLLKATLGDRDLDEGVARYLKSCRQLRFWKRTTQGPMK